MDALRLLTRSTSLNIPKGDSSQAAGVVAQAPQKRKFDAIDSPGGRRTVFKQCNVKIADLRSIHSSTEGTSKKERKEAALIFPEPLLDFKDLKVNKSLFKNVANQHFPEPTDVQLASIPLLLGSEGEEPDLITVAPTGSGKTLAFLIPLINKIALEHRAGDGTRHVQAIILAPTKELVSQIVEEGRKMIHRTGVTVSAMRKGMRLHEDVEASTESESESGEEAIHKRRASYMVKSDIIVSTPQPLVNAFAGRTLANITTLVLDEADVLLDPLFRDQTLSVWSACTNPSLRTSLWSATIGSNIEALALSKMDQRHTELAISPVPRLLRVVVGLKDSSLPASVTHKFIYAGTEQGKLLGLRQLIHPAPSRPTQKSKPAPPELKPHLPFLIFTQTIDRATALAHEVAYDLPPSPTGIPRIAVLNSTLSHSRRTETLANFRSGHTWVLITTDLLSRGLDIPNIATVINYDIPNTVAGYIHRAGRTGRLSSRTTLTNPPRRTPQACVTLWTHADSPYLRPLATLINTSSPGAIPAEIVDNLPAVSKKVRHELKTRGVEVRRASRPGVDDEKTKRAKRKARIGTESGYDKRLKDRRRGAVEGSKRRMRKAMEKEAGEEAGAEEDWSGFE